MVERVKLGLNLTKKAFEQCYDLIVLAATSAAVVKLATQPHVKFSFGNVPVWQIIAGLLLAGILVHEYKLRNEG